jgi:uncharacterized membrane protein YfcA
MIVLTGFLIALSIGLTGVGGGSLTVPALILIFRLPPVEAVATALLYSAVVKTPAAAVYAARGKIHWPTLKIMLQCGVTGLFFGLLLLRGLQNRKGVVLTAVGLIILLSTLLSLYRNYFHGRMSELSPKIPALFELTSLLIGMSVGFSSSGAGSLGMAALLALTPLAAHEAVGTDLIFGLVLSLLGGLVNLGVGRLTGSVIDPQLLLKLAAGGIAGGVTGSLLAAVIPRQPVRIGVQLMLILNGAQLVWQGVRGGF